MSNNWRPLQLIHPALYVSLVHQITTEKHWILIRKRFEKFAENDRIICQSLPIESLGNEKDKAEQVTHWWHKVEQEAIALALDYEFVIYTDITNCYGAIYTHSIAWALHTKPVAKTKENRNNQDLIGNIIDKHIMAMCYGQTNGIPQGSVLMDFIAEMVLGYADLELKEKIDKQKVKDYRILRYRDDYRIFVNSSQDGEKILKCLTEVMIDLTLKLNPAKTKTSDQIIKTSIKPDKLEWILKKQRDNNLQKHLLIIHDHSTTHPNAGSLVRALGDYQKQISKLKECNYTIPLISIVVDIAYRNPRTYPICAAILSQLLSFLDTLEKKMNILEKIKKKFDRIPNTGYMEIWLQRIGWTLDFKNDFNEPLCKLVWEMEEKEKDNDDVQIWNNEWIQDELKRLCDPKQIIDKARIDQLKPIISIEEVELYLSGDMGYQ